jgi:2-pyrone-4,6-dicarboxylate lactonase
VTDPNFITDKGRKPKLIAPPNSCDTHSHVYGPLDQFPRTNGSTRLATLEAYRGMLARLGIERCVVVHSSAYGFDNSVTLDAIAQIGQDRARGMAVIPTDITKEELHKLHAGGMRGVRVSGHGAELSAFDADKIAAQIADLGWALQLQEPSPGWVQKIAPMAKELPIPTIFDHLGKTPVEESTAGEDFHALVKLLEDNDHIWVKIAAIYSNSNAGPPNYVDVGDRVRVLTETRPDRVIWGVNWPHPRFKFDGIAESADVLDPLLDWIPDETTRKMVLADNPGKLYGFDS